MEYRAAEKEDLNSGIKKMMKKDRIKKGKLWSILRVKGADPFSAFCRFFYRFAPFSLVFLLIPILIVGCGKHGEIISGSFSDNQLLMSTKFDEKLIRSSILMTCFDSPSSRILKETTRKHFKKSIMRTYHELFPAGSSAIKVITILELTGAQCLEEKNSKNNFTSCKLQKEYIYGLRGLYLQGWKIHRAILTVNSFEYLIVAKNNRILNVSSRSISSECFELDKKLYEQLKTVIPIRRL